MCVHLVSPHEEGGEARGLGRGLFGPLLRMRKFQSSFSDNFPMKPVYVDGRTSQLQMKVEQEQGNSSDGKKSPLKSTIFPCFLKSYRKNAESIASFLNGQLAYLSVFGFA